jgi:hypothetical protein
MPKVQSSGRSALRRRVNQLLAERGVDVRISEARSAAEREMLGATTFWSLIRIGLSSFVTTSISMSSHARSVHWRAGLVEPITAGQAWITLCLDFTSVGQTGRAFPQRTLAMHRVAWLLLLAGCAPASNPTTPSEPVAYVAGPLQPSNCGTPDQPASCKERKQHREHEHEGRIIWTPEPFYPIIQEPLPDLTPLTRLKWPDE